MLHSLENSETNIVPAEIGGAGAVVRQANTDDQLVELWLHGRSRRTQQAYRADSKQFMSWASRSLHSVTLGDLQAFASSFEHVRLSAASVHRKLSAVKSLFAFAHRLGYLPFDVARPLRLPGVRNQLNERILDEGEVQKMFVLERSPRNRAMLRLLYAAGLRVSELCGLQWRDLHGRDDGGQVTVFGKGEKTRTILLPTSVWRELLPLRGSADEDGPVFRSRKRGHLHPTQVWRIVGQAARRAGIARAVSTHWLRHAHASHALDRGAPIHLVQTTLGHASVATTGRYLHARPSDSSSNYLPL